MIPVALTIAGSDCSAGAGIQADLKTFQHFHVHGLTAVTCVVSETADVVRAVHPVPVEIVIDQTSLLLDSFPVAAMKTGMLFSAAHVRALADLFESRSIPPLVIDPVMIASTGAPLIEEDAIRLYQERLLPLARVITPNLPEAERLLDHPIPDEAAMEPAARELAERYGCAVLLKGGHLENSDCLDLLVDGDGTHRFVSPRIPVEGSHGTGCTLSAAVTAGLASGLPLPDAVSGAKDFLNRALQRSYRLPGSPGIHALDQGTRGDP